MKKVHSLSGGKTSSYMAVHYPADYYIFSIVRIDDKQCKPKDEQLIKVISEKIKSDFIATAEDDLTLYAMLDLEQKIGKEIIWVSSEKSFDSLIKKKSNYLPNKLTRYCTSELKIRPIFDYWFNNIKETIEMGIGYRWDEMERAQRFTEDFKGIVGKSGNRNKWQLVKWRKGWFPLIEDKVIHPTVIRWANQSGIKFPNDSNCVGCFHKPVQQLRKNWEQNECKMGWFSNQESKSKGTWKENITYEKIKTIGLQQDFIFGTGSGCDAGFCTD